MTWKSFKDALPADGSEFWYSSDGSSASVVKMGSAITADWAGVWWDSLLIPPPLPKYVPPPGRRIEPGITDKRKFMCVADDPSGASVWGPEARTERAAVDALDEFLMAIGQGALEYA